MRLYITPVSCFSHQKFIYGDYFPKCKDMFVKLNYNIINFVLKL